jgi:hypothetical protein
MINLEKMEFLISLIQQASLYKKELNSRLLVNNNYKIQMIEGRDSFLKNKICIQDKLRERKDFILDFYIFRKIRKCNGYKIVNMTFNTYLRCTKIILRIVYSFRTNRMNSKNILNHLKPKNKISDNSFKNKKFISNINNHKSQYRLFH